MKRQRTDSKQKQSQSKTSPTKRRQEESKRSESQPIHDPQMTTDTDDEMNLQEEDVDVLDHPDMEDEELEDVDWEGGGRKTA
jgi:hypothetical protein